MTEAKCKAKMVCMGMDAFRICIGLKPRNFQVAEVVAYIVALSRLASK